MPKVYNKKIMPYPKDAIYIGRPTPFGNPFKIGEQITREGAVEAYQELINWSKIHNPAFIHMLIDNLKGRDLLCWCAPSPCHGDIILTLVNADNPWENNPCH